MSVEQVVVRPPCDCQAIVAEVAVEFAAGWLTSATVGGVAESELRCRCAAEATAAMVPATATTMAKDVKRRA